MLTLLAIETIRNISVLGPVGVVTNERIFGAHFAGDICSFLIVVGSGTANVAFVV